MLVWAQMQNTTDNAHPGLTQRQDFWWFLPAVMIVSGIVATVYLTWSALFAHDYAWGPYVSPLYHVPLVPSFWPISPAFLLLWIPAGFRLTCYYGRKVYHRAVFGSPMACSVEEPYRKKYRGESRFPFVLNNLHRYFLYFALLLVCLHWYELLHTFWFHGEIYLGFGTLLILIDTLALTGYVFGCHALRHLVGGKERAMVGCSSCTKSCGKMKYNLWKKVTFFNIFHNVWFWVSLFSIALADLYIRLLALGIFSFDPHVII